MNKKFFLIEKILFCLIAFIFLINAHQSDRALILKEFLENNFLSDNAVLNCGILTPSKKTFFQKIFSPDTPNTKKEMLFSEKEIGTMFVSNLESKEFKNNSLLYQVVRDINLFKDFDGSSANFFFVLLNMTTIKTIAGKAMLGYFLSHPTDKKEFLLERQLIIRSLMQNENYKEKLLYHLEQTKLHEIHMATALGNNLFSKTESEVIFSKIPFFSSSINSKPFLYNLMCTVPIILQTTMIPVIFTGLCISLAHLLINATNQKANTMIQKLAESTKKTKDEIVSEYLTMIKSLSEKERQEKLRAISSYVVRTRGSLDDFEFFGVFGGMPIEEQEKILTKKEHTFSEDIEFVVSNYNEVLKRAGNNAKIVLRTMLGLPSILLGKQGFQQLHIVIAKMSELQTYLYHLVMYMKQAEEIVAITKDIPLFKETMILKPLLDFQSNKEFSKLRSLFSSNLFQEKKHWCNPGIVLVTFQEVQKHKDLFLQIMQSIGKIDLFFGLANLMNQYHQKDNGPRFCFAKYDTNKKEPLIDAKQFWNPFILSHKSISQIIPNSLLLGRTELTSGIFTGPNTCGKTTILLGILINIILAQTFGIAAADYFEITPFHKLHATLSVNTSSAIGDSRFKAEVREALKTLKTIKKAEEIGYFVLNIQDELFTGTNPQDGEEAAYQFLETIGQYKRSINLIATHYNRLTQLEKPYEKYKINASLTSNNTVNKLFTLSKGISQLNIAPIILKEAGFSKN